jgi:hypothetical protein
LQRFNFKPPIRIGGFVPICLIFLKKIKMDPHLFHVDEKAAHDTKPEGKKIKTAPRPFHVDGKTAQERT